MKLTVLKFDWFYIKARWKAILIMTY